MFFFSLCNSFLLVFWYMVELSTSMGIWRLSVSFIPLQEDTDSTDSKTGSSLTFARSVSVRPKCFNGDTRIFKEQCFYVWLVFPSRNIEVDFSQVEFASSCYEGNALLWLIACQDSGTAFNGWIDFQSALAITFAKRGGGSVGFVFSPTGKPTGRIHIQEFKSSQG